MSQNCCLSFRGGGGEGDLKLVEAIHYALLQNRVIYQTFWYFENNMLHFYD